MRILAVDDDEIILELLKATLEVEGFTDVQTATSGQQALYLIHEEPQPFDCILLDIQMPEMDGISLCAKIRSMSAYRKCPILMITAMSDRKYIDRAFSAGATDYVNKPFDVLELGTRIKLAKKLNDERKAYAESSFKVDALRTELQESKKCDLSEPISIQDVDGVITYLAFENYLLQLSRAGLFSSTVFAIKVTNVRSIYTRCSPSDFVYTITDIGEAIALNVKHLQCLVSYRGDGVFVCVCHHGQHLNTEEFEINVRNTLYGMDLTYEGGASLPVRLVFGNLESAGFFAKQGTLKMLLKAVENVETKSVAESSKNALVSQTVGTETRFRDREPNSHMNIFE